MATIGKANLTIVPKFDGLGKSVAAALDGVDTRASGVGLGAKMSAGFAQGAGGLVKSGAVVGIFSAITSKAMDLISSSVGGAVSRLDTMNNYPRVMEALGYSAESSQASIGKMADRLKGLPTSLDSMVNYVQQLSASTEDLPYATDLGIGFNDMLLAAASSSEAAASAQYQFNQMLATGNVDMQAWRSLIQAAPGQMNQLAKSTLGANASQGDLYAALKDGVLTMDDLSDAIIRLDTEGGDGFQSFSEQARNATGGVETGAANMQTAVVRGMTGIMDAVGSETISTALSDVGGGFEAALGVVADGVAEAKPLITGFVGAMETVVPAAVPAAAAIGGVVLAGKGLGSLPGLGKKVLDIVSPVGRADTAAKGLSDTLFELAYNAKDGSRQQKLLQTASERLAGSMGGPVVAGIGLAVVAAAVWASKAAETAEKTRLMEESTDGLREAARAAASPVKSVADAYGDIAAESGPAVKGLGEIKAAMEESAESGAALKKSIEERTEATSTSIGLLEAYRGTIEEYTALGELNATQQAELKLAIDGVNEACGTQYSVVDAAKGVIADESGTIQENTDKINENIEARERSLKIEALSADYKDLYGKHRVDVQNLSDAEAYLAQCEKDLADANLVAALGTETLTLMRDDAAGHVAALSDVERESAAAMADVSAAMVGVTSGADMLKEHLVVMAGDSAEVASALRNIGKDASGLADELVAAGVSSDELARVGQEDFAAMLSGCGGDITRLAGMIGKYNATPIIDKDGDVNVEAATLWDAQDRLYTWNGTAFVDKDGSVAVDDTRLQDSQGRLYTWNGSSLYDQNGNAVVRDGVPLAQQRLDWWNASYLADHEGAGSVIDDGMTYANGEKADWNASGLASWIGEGSINIVKNITEFITGGHAAGGIRTHADGGYRLHAGGAIATRAVPLDIVGEDGAEAIVPLTNRQYSLPFARTLAGLMSQEPGKDEAPRLDEERLASLFADALSRVAIYVDGKKLNRALAAGMNEELARYGKDGF